MRVLTGASADEAWRDAAGLFVADGPARLQSGRGGDAWEVLHVGMTVGDPRQRWVASRAPAMNPAFALVEAFWILAGRRDSALPLYWNPKLSEFCGDGPTYHGAYGFRLRSHFGVDQLDRICQVLSTDPDSRQCVLQIWDPELDLPDVKGLPASRDIPCNVMSLPKVRGGRLEWMQIIRSNDLFLGVPHNLVQFTLMQETLAGWMGIKIGQYHQLSDSLHVYVRDIEKVRDSQSVIPAETSTDDYALDRRTWASVVPRLMARLEEMTDPSLSPERLRQLALYSDAPDAYENVARIAAADAARRRGWIEFVPEVAEALTNPVLRLLWDRWHTRVPKRQRA